jgi:hypothetical protein
MMLVCVALTRGRVFSSSSPTTAAPFTQPRTVMPLPEVTPSLCFKNRNSESIKTEIRSKNEQRPPYTGREGGEYVWQ